MKDNNTQIQQVDVDLDEVLGLVNGDNIITPEPKKPSIFSDPRKMDLSFLDKPEKEEDELVVEEEDTIEPVTDDDVSDVLGLDDVVEDPTKKNTGRPKVAKDGLVALFKEMIDKGDLLPFEDEKPIEEYTQADFHELLAENLKAKEEELRSKTPVEFFESLPQELQIAAKYVADGGKDMKGLFRVLAQAEEIRQLDVTDETDHEEIARQYLRATNFGTEEDIDESIDEWKDQGLLKNKVEKFKPKLDKMQEEITSRKLGEQQKLRAQQEEMATVYRDSIYDTLKAGEINGLKLDKKIQNMLYSGLIQPSYPSMTGKQTNLLGHLLEKHQFVEPDHALVAEALYLLADPEGYRNKIREQGAKDAKIETAKKLKTEQQLNRTNSSGMIEETEQRTRKIPRTNNFFKKL